MRQVRQQRVSGRAAAILLCLAALLSPLACSGPAGDPKPPKSRNVILVLLDTVRADRLGCHGGGGGITPRLDSFAAEAVRFEQAFSHAPWTLPAASSIFTSQYPVQHGAGGRLGSFSILGEEAVTLAELFKEAGFATGAVVNVLFLTERFGTTQGFDTVFSNATGDNRTARQAGPTTLTALKWLDSLGEQPFFLLVHYFDPHLTYDPPPRFRKRFADPRDSGGGLLFGTVSDIVGFRSGERTLDQETIARLEKLHNGEVAYLDSELGRLLDGLETRGLGEETAVAVTADHGEEFYDHGGFEHGHTLYDELLHVPLIIRTPGAGSGLTVPVTVRHIDLAPTLCELAGIPPHPAFAGESLVELLMGGEGPDRPVLSQGNMWGPSGLAWRREGYKLIRPSPQAPYQLFRVADDLKERHDLAFAEPERSRRLAGELEQILLDQLSPSGGDAPQLTTEETNRLRALGYLEE